jgi:hypothetical protein
MISGNVKIATAFTGKARIMKECCKQLKELLAEPFQFLFSFKEKLRMSTNEIAARLAELCREGKWETAQTELFAEDAVSIEPYAGSFFDKETKGLHAIIDKGRKFDGMVLEVHRIEVTDPIVTTLAIAFKLVMDITMKERPRESWEEICIYTVKDGKISSEQFFM